MYLEYYGFKALPFAITSDPSFIFFSRRHQEAFDHLLYGIRQRVGFVEITGEIGCGKTTLCRALLNHLGEDTKTAFIFNSSLTETQLMQTLLHDLGLDPARKNRYGLFSELNRFLIEQLVKGNNVVLIIDEAQNLSIRLLEQVRMLSNLETEKEKLLQIILVGQPELRRKLDSPSLRQLRQRIAVRYHIGPLGPEEIGPYIRHRIVTAGANGAGPDFDAEALEEIGRYSGGVPRLVNILCDKALLLSFVQSTRRVTRGMVSKSVEEIEGKKP